ncbi:MAG: hypothetical protein WCR52_06940 [Bacteroidota bacterium]
MLDTLQLSAFQPYLNQNISIRFTPEVTLESELIEAKETRSSTVNDNRAPFSLVFRTQQKTEYYNQANFIVLHPELGEIVMFMVPIGFDAVGMMYQAIFN